MMKYQYQATVCGRVQGVGFRHYVRNRAIEQGLSGYVRNLPSRQVEVVAEGDEPALETLMDNIRIGPPLARVVNVEFSRAPFTGAYNDFEIRF